MKFFTCSLLLVLAVSLQADWKSTEDALVSGNGATGSQFGYSVDVGEKYAVVGAKDEGSGAAYVFQKEDNGSWTKQMQLPNPISSITTSGFGASVAIAESSALNANPDFIVVGAPESYEAIGGVTFHRGEICIYERNSTTSLWEQHQACIVEASNTLGFSVDVSNYKTYYPIIYSHAKIVAGDPKNDTNKTNAGAVYFYDYDTSSDVWSLNETAYAPEEHDASTTEGMHFGYSVALYGDISIIGAPYADVYENGSEVHYTDVGAAYFYNTNGVKIQEMYGFAYGITRENKVGLAVDISYHKAIIGARGGSMNPNGYATVYDDNGSGWEASEVLEGSTINSDNEDFAHSVAIKGNHIAVGAPKKSVGGLELGAVYIYDKYDEGESSTWEESTHDYGTGNSLFGNSVSLYGDTLMVGAPGSEEVQVYDYSEPMEVNPALIMYLLN